MADRPSRWPPPDLPGGSRSSAEEQRWEWATATTAPNQLVAEVLRELLLNQGIPAMLAPGDTFAFLGVSPAPCRVLVPAHLLAQAEAVMEADDWTAEAVEEDRD